MHRKSTGYMNIDDTANVTASTSDPREQSGNAVL